MWAEFLYIWVLYSIKRCLFDDEPYNLAEIFNDIALFF